MKYGERRVRHIPEYRSWQHMIGRCCNPSDDAYARYGGRGVTVEPRWLNDFEAFLADMGPRPSLGHTLDRLNNDGPYSPANCRWATRVEQNNNRSTNVIVLIDGVSTSLREIAERSGVPYKTVAYRYRSCWPAARLGAPIELAQDRTHCKHGHEFTPENTKLNRRGARVCKACDLRRTHQYRGRA